MQLKELENDHNSSLLLKPSLNLELLINQFNNATLKIIMTLKKFLHPNIMTSVKCIALKYLSEINHYRYSILIYVLLIKILMTFNIY